MAFCPNCGKEHPEGVNFCPSCGYQLNGEVSQEVTTYTTTVPVSTTVNSNFSAGIGEVEGYNVVLLNVGTCDPNYADDVITDLLGYTLQQSRNLVASTPVLIAQALTKRQALFVSQAMTEYGMQVAVYDANGYVDMDIEATSSVFKQDGSLLARVAEVLGTITVANQVSRLIQWNTPGFADYIFRPRYIWTNPLHIRNRFAPPRRMPAPPAPRPRAPRREPAPAPRGMGGPGGRGGMGGGPSGGPGGRGGRSGGPGGRGGRSGGPGGRGRG